MQLTDAMVRSIQSSASESEERAFLYALQAALPSSEFAIVIELPEIYRIALYPEIFVYGRNAREMIILLRTLSKIFDTLPLNNQWEQGETVPIIMKMANNYYDYRQSLGARGYRLAVDHGRNRQALFFINRKQRLPGLNNPIEHLMNHPNIFNDKYTMRGTINMVEGFCSMVLLGDLLAKENEKSPLGESGTGILR
jgi:hypothetical protein